MAAHACRIPEIGDRSSYMAAIEALPLVQTPEVFGLHANADISYYTSATKALWRNLVSVSAVWVRVLLALHPCALNDASCLDCADKNACNQAILKQMPCMQVKTCVKHMEDMDPNLMQVNTAGGLAALCGHIQHRCQQGNLHQQCCQGYCWQDSRAL